MKNIYTIFFICFLLVSCQKTALVTQDPLPDTPRTYLSKIEYFSTSDSSLAVLPYSDVDSFLYNDRNEITEKRISSFYNGVLFSTSSQVFRRQANQVFTSFGDGVERYTATLEPFSGNVISSIHVRDFSHDGKDSVYWEEYRYDYSPEGFLQKETEKFNKAHRLGELRFYWRGENVWTIINDGKNVTKKILLVNQTDSIFKTQNGALIGQAKTMQRLTYTITHSADKAAVFSTYSYSLGKADLNLISSQSLVIEVSKDNGLTWQVDPGGTGNSTFVHQIAAGVLLKTTIKRPDENRVMRYYYLKR